MIIPGLTLAAVIVAAVGGAVEAIAGKTIESPGLRERFQKLNQLVEEQPLSEAEAAVLRAIDNARAEMRDDLQTYGDTDPNMLSQMDNLLGDPVFAAALAQRVLFRGQPDWQRLRLAYRDIPADRMPSADIPWNALEPLLEVYFVTIENHLFVDAYLGPVLRDTQKLASLSRLEQSNDIIAEAVQAVVGYQERIAVAGEQSATGISTLVGISGRAEAHLGELLALLRTYLAQQPPLPPRPAPGFLHADEAAYLNLLREQCDRLPLADDDRASPRRKGQASLARVYVDLQTDTHPDIETVFERLQIPQSQRQQLHSGLQMFDDSFGRAGRAKGASFDEVAVLRALAAPDESGQRKK